MAIDISVVISTIGRADLLAQVLRALERQSSSFETIVVSDGEDPGTRRLAADVHVPFPIHWIFCSENRGQAFARNLGVARAKGSLLAFLDDDTVPGPGWLDSHARHHKDSSSKRVVLGRLVHVYSNAPSTNMEHFLRETVAIIQKRLEQSLSRMDMKTRSEFWIGLNSSIPRVLFLAHGGFNPALRDVEEDAELASRLATSDVQFVYEPDALVYHHNTKDLEKSHLVRAEQFALADLHRSRVFRQLDILPEMIIQGNIKQKLKSHLVWYMPRSSAYISKACRSGAEFLNSDFLFRQWYDLSFLLGYYRQMKNNGLSLQDIRNLS
ncbi:glycosyltransferase family 2 protein [bacterium]|nr:glycosyltransferase family 2 protein [bacterium]